MVVSNNVVVSIGRVVVVASVLGVSIAFVGVVLLVVAVHALAVL